MLLALGNIKKVGEVVERPKALGDIRGVTYIYGMFYRFGLINVPDEAKEKDEESIRQIVLTRMPQRGGRSITQCLRSLRDPEITQKSTCGMNHRRLKSHYSLFKKSSRT